MLLVVLEVLVLLTVLEVALIKGSVVSVWFV